MILNNLKLYTTNQFTAVAYLKDGLWCGACFNFNKHHTTTHLKKVTEKLDEIFLKTFLQDMIV